MLTVTVNGITYAEGAGQLNLVGNTWALQIPGAETLGDGIYNVTATDSDPAGNVSIDPTVAELLVDSALPRPPTVDSQATSDSTPIIVGTFDSASAGGGFSVSVAGVTYVLGQDNELSAAGDNWTLNLATAAPLADGSYEVTASSVTNGGLVSSDLTNFEILVDATPPAVPAVDLLATTNTAPTVTGSASLSAGEILRVTVDGVTYTEGDGNLSLIGNRWSLAIPTGNNLADGRYDVAASVVDAVGNISRDGSTNELTVDTTLPLFGDQAHNYEENSPANTVIGQVAASDNIGFSDFGFTWADGSLNPISEDGIFTIDNSGNVRITSTGANGDANDFESGSNSRTYSVVATDTVGHATNAAVTLQLQDAIEVPPVPEPAAGPIDPGSPLGEYAGDDTGSGFISDGDDGGAGGDASFGLGDLDDTIQEVTDIADDLWNIVDDKVHLGVSLEDQPIAAEGITQLTLPTDTFTHDDPFAQISVDATLADGAALPEYVTFDPESQTFEVDGEAAIAEGVTEFTVQIVGTDDQGETASGNFTIEVLGADGQPIAGTPAAAPEQIAGDTTTPTESSPAEQGDVGSTPTISTEGLVLLTVSLDDQRILAEGDSTIALPANTFEHTDPDQTVAVAATLEDGSPLPEYVDFDPDTMTFEINGDAAAAAGEEQIVVLLVGTDSSGNSASGMFVINVEDVDQIMDLQGDQLLPGMEQQAPVAEGDEGGETGVDETLESPEEEPGEQQEEESSEQLADGRKNLDLQLEQASRYNFVDRIEQLLEDVKNLFT